MISVVYSNGLGGTGLQWRYEAVRTSLPAQLIQPLVTKPIHEFGTHGCALADARAHVHTLAQSLQRECRHARTPRRRLLVWPADLLGGSV